MRDFRSPEPRLIFQAPQRSQSAKGSVSKSLLTHFTHQKYLSYLLYRIRGVVLINCASVLCRQILIIRIMFQLRQRNGIPHFLLSFPSSLWCIVLSILCNLRYSAFSPWYRMQHFFNSGGLGIFDQYGIDANNTFGSYWVVVYHIVQLSRWTWLFEASSRLEGPWPKWAVKQFVTCWY